VKLQLRASATLTGRVLIFIFFFTANVAVIRLPSQSQVGTTFAGVLATISGFGRTTQSEFAFKYVDLVCELTMV
jgi:hypothetical protein